MQQRERAADVGIAHAGQPAVALRRQGVDAFTLWKPDALKVTRGSDQIGTFNKTPRSGRKWCKACGGHLFTDHPHWGLVDVYAAVIPDFPFKPGVHVNYQESKLHISDGLPKLKDLPKEMDGSGALAEVL
jgi:hypothetical protein